MHLFIPYTSRDSIALVGVIDQSWKAGRELLELGGRPLTLQQDAVLSPLQLDVTIVTALETSGPTGGCPVSPPIQEY